MSRRRIAKKRSITLDPIYGDIKIAKFINILMLRGQKTTAENILYKSLAKASKKSSIDCLELFHKALENVRPLVEVRSRRVGGATYQVPVDVNESRSWVLGMRFIIQSARKKTGSDMASRLSIELMDAYNKKGDAIKLKEEKHKTAEANRAFSQFRW
ncbi:30S ribosomal subunit protein S7 [Candidatus Xenohaliotis californiensis]|uniref:Small ribosomal subunit protein uS7 n=1 Tax=Candidatus Xenohaliotis californiensis TaxID=84677 RepID=A0ABP0ESL3_9RICK|nr:30S ribosomal subunit protein S7 [Candidatus Xenohaliotis californiensis]